MKSAIGTLITTGIKAAGKSSDVFMSGAAGCRIASREGESETVEVLIEIKKNLFSFSTGVERDGTCRTNV